MEFCPIAIETSGRLDSTTTELLKQISELTASLWQIQSTVILKYWIKILSCTVQREMARNIIQHTSPINGRLKQPIVDPLVEDYRCS